MSWFLNREYMRDENDIMTFADAHDAKPIAVLRPRHFTLDDQNNVHSLEHPLFIVCINGIAFIGTENQVLNFKYGFPEGDPQSYEYRRNVELMRRGRI